nr:retrovirus-related Pol polyprotein from transposon TNT 1-94 [Tanacetum cinerariifolium]
MSTLFKSQELWELVENGFVDSKPAEPDQALRDNRKKDAKALFFIQSALDDDNFHHIASANTSNQAWEILKQEFLGDRKVITVILQTLRWEFEMLKMKDKESLQDYLSRVSGIVNQMKSYELNDLSVYTFDELIGSLLAHEDRIGRGRGRGGFNGRGHGRSRGHGQFTKQNQFNEHKSFTPRNHIKCKNCKKPGHKESECSFKPKDDQHASFVEKKNEETLFITHIHDGSVHTDFCFIDSGCSSHMCRSRSLFVDLDTSKNSIVRLEDDKQVQVEGKGTIAINTTTGKKNVLHGVLFVPKLAHNLLSIGHLMCCGLVIVFDDGQKAMVVKAWKDYDIWHLRYGYLHLNSLKLLENKDMVMGLPNINNLEFYEGCILGKQSRNSFLVGKSWRASRHFELVHADLCGPMNTESLNRNPAVATAVYLLNLSSTKAVLNRTPFEA